MTDTLAYQIAAAFFLAALFMAGTLTRGLFPVGVVQNIRLTTFAVVALVVCWALYREMPDLRGTLAWTAWTSDTAMEKAPADRTPGNAAKENAVLPAIRLAPVVHTQPPISAPAEPVQAGPPVPEEPVHIQAAPVPAERVVDSQPVRRNGNPVTRAAKSVRNLLHLGRNKYQQPAVPPVPASIEEK